MPDRKKRDPNFDPELDDAIRSVQRLLSDLEQRTPQTQADVTRGLGIRLTKGRIGVGRLHYSAKAERDPEVHPEWKAAERRTYTSQAAWDREQEIIDEAGGGELVFADTLITHWKKIVITDPDWRPDPEWETIEGGFDYGKTNPTALLRAYHGFDGTTYYCGEYYQPGREIWEHAPEILRMRDYNRIKIIHADPSMFQYMSQQSQRPGYAVERARSYAELYREAGIDKLWSYGGDRSDVSFAARLHLHWADLEHREPTVKIVCRNYAEVPQPGLHQWDCPNLLWELMRTRRVKLNAQQLLSRNVSEAVVDKDNHARDAMKYHLMSHPEPSTKSFERRVNERLSELHKVDPTFAAMQYPKIVQEEQQEEDYEPIYYGRNGRRIVREFERRLRRRWWGFPPRGF